MSTQVSASTYTADTPLAETLDGIQLNDPAYFKTDHEWSLISFLLYRQQCSDFQPSKLAKYDRYARNLTNIINWEGAQPLDGVTTCVQSSNTPDYSREVPLDGVTACVQSSNTPDYGQKCKEKKSMLIIEFWESATSTEKRKLTAISERTMLMEEHATAVMNLTSQQDRIIREKFTRNLENSDTNNDRSHKRQRGQGNEDEIHQPATPKNKEYEHDSESSDDPYINSDSSYEVQGSRYSSSTPHSHEDPFTEDTVDENVLITNVPSRLSSSKSSESDLFVNGVNILEKFRTYISESILHANNKGLYIESHSHEILSLSSILVLIPNSYSTKMVESFGLDVLESIYREYTPKLSLQLDIEIENVYRSVVKTCLNDSRDNAIKLLCVKIVQKNELMNNFCFLILDLIRNLPYDKIRNEPSELTLITNYLDNIMKNAFHIPDRHAKQPDFVVSVNYQSRASNVIYVGEVTGPSEQGNVYKNCLDLVRIGIFMKDCMDSAVSQGAEIKILGFQCIAYRIDFYMLNLR
ncbi:9400_t:CDS:2, partial [Funneliformis caledonium]